VYVGGGNQLRQPYLKTRLTNDRAEDFPNCEHVHFFGWYWKLSRIKKRKNCKAGTIT